MASRGRRKSVGVVEMAHDLGVSTATISRALNGSPSVRRELADRIRAHAEARGYVANRLARALSASTSRAFVGFVIPYVDTLAYSAVAAECARLLSAAGTQMILAITENDAEREYEQLRDLVGTRIAGLVISPSTHLLDETRHLLAELPVVELHRVSGIDVPSVLSDDEQALADSIVHLAALGHTEIAYLGTPRELSNGAIRLRGIRRGVARAGLDPRRITMRLVEPTQENGRAATCELLAGGVPFTALVVGSGSLSVGAADAVRRSGRRLPGDLSLVVYGDPSWFVLADPPLTMIQVQYAALAGIAARLLLCALDAREVGSRPPAAGPHFVPAELRVAGSTGPPPGQTTVTCPPLTATIASPRPRSPL
jgi:DNA-binding LacI/PurR family transcriptional regulator